jgi:hypothetical protein
MAEAQERKYGNIKNGNFPYATGGLTSRQTKTVDFHASAENPIRYTNHTGLPPNPGCGCTKRSVISSSVCRGSIREATAQLLSQPMQNLERPPVRVFQQTLRSLLKKPGPAADPESMVVG